MNIETGTDEWGKYFKCGICLARFDKHTQAQQHCEKLLSPPTKRPIAPPDKRRKVLPYKESLVTRSKVTY